uniref:Uncharacterized protein n=1 Tax=Geoglobus ahangari TaxID=113653 RepID=A0A7C4S5D7_9EURY
MVGLIYGLLFLILALIEIKINILNSFVLFTISAIFLKGAVKSKENYYFVGALIAIIFAVLSLLVLIATADFSYGLFGFFALPYFFILKRRLTAD